MKNTCTVTFEQCVFCPMSLDDAAQVSLDSATAVDVYLEKPDSPQMKDLSSDEIMAHAQVAVLGRENVSVGMVAGALLVNAAGQCDR